MEWPRILGMLLYSNITKWVKTAQCKHCKQVGHIEAMCPTKSKPQSYANQVVSPGNNVETTQAEAEIELDAFQVTLKGNASTYLASNMLPQWWAWVIDSGCSHHMTPISDNYISYTPYSSPQSMHLAGKSITDTIGEGTVRLFTMVEGVKHKIHLHHTLLIPTLANSLFSVKTVNWLGYSAIFRPYGVFIENPGEVIIAESEEGGNLYDLCILHDSFMASTAHTHDRVTLTWLPFNKWSRRG